MSIPSRKSRREMGSFRPRIWSRRGQWAIRQIPPARHSTLPGDRPIVAPRRATMLYFRFVANAFVLGVVGGKLLEPGRKVKGKGFVRGRQLLLRSIGEFDGLAWLFSESLFQLYWQVIARLATLTGEISPGFRFVASCFLRRPDGVVVGCAS